MFVNTLPVWKPLQTLFSKTSQGKKWIKLLSFPRLGSHCLMSVSPCTHCLCNLIQQTFLRSDRPSLAYVIDPLTKENKHPDSKEMLPESLSESLPLFFPSKLSNIWCPCTTAMGVPRSPVSLLPTSHRFGCHPPRGIQTLQWAAQGGGGVTLPGSAQEMSGCGIWCHGLVGKVVIGQRLDLVTSEILYKPNDYVISHTAGEPQHCLQVSTDQEFPQRQPGAHSNSW